HMRFVVKLYLSMTLLSSISTLFPYTTLFRSCIIILYIFIDSFPSFKLITFIRNCFDGNGNPSKIHSVPVSRIFNPGGFFVYIYRSEEHTSELQSRENLVCRLLLEKKNNK